MSRPFSVEACDFSGWATRNDLKCSDGRVIRRDAFKNNDGIKVSMTPLMVKLRKSLSSTVTSVLCPFTPISSSRLVPMCCMVVFAK